MDLEITVSASDNTKLDEPEHVAPADRIRELSEIDEGITKILATAGQAVQALSTGMLKNNSNEPALDTSKAQFESCANEYVLASQSVIARLRRQIYALEEAKIIAARPTAKDLPPAARSQAKLGDLANRFGASTANPVNKQRRTELANGGLGKFDVGWLNSRIDMVGKQKEAELWSQARDLLQEHLSKEEPGHENHVAVEEDVSMHD